MRHPARPACRTHGGSAVTTPHPTSRTTPAASDEHSTEPTPLRTVARPAPLTSALVAEEPTFPRALWRRSSHVPTMRSRDPICPTPAARARVSDVGTVAALCCEEQHARLLLDAAAMLAAAANAAVAAQATFQCDIEFPWPIASTGDPARSCNHAAHRSRSHARCASRQRASPRPHRRWDRMQ